MNEGKSRWADDADARRREKEEKKRLKPEKQKQRDAADTARATADESERAAKRQRLSPKPEGEPNAVPLLRFAAPGWGPCRHVDNFERLNHIEEGSYGSVSRAKESATGTVVALKKLKMDGGSDGFPVTALREIETLQRSRHRHIVNLREVVVGNKLDEWVFRSTAAVANGISVFLVMDFLEHDLKTLQEQMIEPFLPSEVKTLMLQITAGVHFLHDNWILHVGAPTPSMSN
jgi:cell division cycle 2-like protein